MKTWGSSEQHSISEGLWRLAIVPKLYLNMGKAILIENKKISDKMHQNLKSGYSQFSTTTAS